MIRVLGDAGGVPIDSLVGVVERALAAGSPAPAWLAVEDPAGAWVRAAAALPATERRRGVVAVASEAGLVAAARLDVGGALWLPPSLAGAAVALDAAAADAAQHLPDASILELVAPAGGELVAVGWANRRFWRQQAGAREMAHVLASLADELGVVPALLPWPLLVLEAGSGAGEEIGASWRRVTRARQVMSEGVEVVPCGRPPDPGDLTAAVMRAETANRDGSGPDPGAWGFPRPVHELPSGRRVGWWSPSECGAAAGGGQWTAVPGAATAAGFRWQLCGAGGTQAEVEDTLGTVAEPAAAIRVPGWVAGCIGPGRPAGLLVERLAATSARIGTPLWVPNLRPGALRFLLRLPGTLWVDGADVPDGG